jgi:ribokinase
MDSGERPVLVIGSLNIDLVACTENLPARGETIFGKTFSRFPGGKGANQAIAAARLGARVAMAGCVGNDAFGSELCAGLTENGVDASQVHTVGTSTGIAMITVDGAGANTIVVVPGANACVSPAIIDQALSRYETPGVLLLQHEIPAAAVSHAACAAKKMGWLVVLNPAPARAVSPAVLANVDILIPNETEAALLTGRPAASFDEAALAAKHLMSLGVGSVVVTMGSQGALCATDRATERIAPVAVKAVDTTAAGDAFIGAVAYALAAGRTLNAGLRLAAAAAALSVTRSGAQPSLPCRRELDPGLL